MRVLVACEFSQAVTKAFREHGHEAYSCDLLEPEGNEAWHYMADATVVANEEPWDLMIAHPPCTYLTVAANRWQHDHYIKRKAGDRFHDGSMHRRERQAALQFVRDLMAAPIPRIAIENPISVISTQIRKPDQIIHPWQFGHGEVKATCLWLKGLPKLTHTNIVEGREPKVHRMTPSPDRWKERSRTYDGIAQAMAAQWGTTDEAAVSQARMGTQPDRESEHG
jgi:hypothetical protein